MICDSWYQQRMEQRRFKTTVKVKSIQLCERHAKHPIAIKLAQSIKIEGGGPINILKIPPNLGRYDTELVKALIPGTKCMMHFNENYVLSRIDDRLLETTDEELNKFVENKRPTKLILMLSCEDGSSYQKVIKLGHGNKETIVKTLDLLIPDCKFEI